MNISLSHSNSSEGSLDNPYKLITRRIDSSKIRRNQKRDLDVTVSNTKDMMIVKDNIPYRSGAIIYTKINGKTYFCLGIDTQSGNITDFGGGVKMGETIVKGGLRELAEESQNIFDIRDVDDSIIFHCYNMAIMFIKTDKNSTQSYNLFRNRMRNEIDPEVCDIVWLTTEEFLESIHGRGHKLYIRVRRLLNKVTDEISNL